MALRKCQRFNDEKNTIHAARVAFGKKLAILREKKGCTQAEFARVAEVYVQELCNVERGDRRASDGFLCQIAYPLGFKAGQLQAWRDQLEMSEEELLSHVEVLIDKRNALKDFLQSRPSNP